MEMVVAICVHDIFYDICLYTPHIWYIGIHVYTYRALSEPRDPVEPCGLALEREPENVAGPSLGFPRPTERDGIELGPRADLE
jgi:hypothetical protein